MFPDRSLVFRKSFETFDGGQFTHTFTETSAKKVETLAARMASRRNIANMLDPKLVVRLEASFGRGFVRLHRNLLGSGGSRTTSTVTAFTGT